MIRNEMGNLPSVIKRKSGFAVVVPDRMAGWKSIGKPFYADSKEAAVASGAQTDARVIPAVREVWEVLALHIGPPLRYRSLRIDWDACLGARNNAGNWYVLRVHPLYQRMARSMPSAEAEEPHRIGESVVERNLRDANIEVYMPAFRAIHRHHRTKKLMEKRQPLLVGYVFVHIGRGDFERVRDVDGVADLMKVRGEMSPVRFRPEDLGVVMLAADQMQRDFTSVRTVERRRQRGRLTNELKRFLPKGRAPRMSLRDHAEAALADLSNAARARVKIILQEIDRLGDDEDSHPKAA